jgi:adenylate cyclase
VVIVEISDESFKSLHDRWPWPRSYYAHLLRNLKAAGAKAVGLDLIFGGNDVYAQRNDSELRATIRQTGLAVLAGKTEVISELYSRTSSTENYGNIFFDVDSSIGLVNIRNDDDGVYRRYSPFFTTTRGDTIPTFGFAILNKYFGYPALTAAQDSRGEFTYAGRSIPKYDPGSLLINFYGPSGTFRHIKFVDVIDDDSLTTIEEEQTGSQTNTFNDPDYGYLYDGTFKDKIVLVGSTVPEEHDLFPVSMAHGEQAGDNLMYGVEIHANVIENILRNDFLRRQSTLSEILGIFFFTIITFFVTSTLRGSKTARHLLIELNGFLFTFAEIFLIGFVSLLLFKKYHYLVAVISPMVGVLGGYVASTAYHFVSERKQRMLIKTMFSTYLDPVVVEELILNPEKLALGGERKELTVLFSDIEGFTTISEGMSPEQLVAVLNEYLSAMSEIIIRNHGTLDKYEGDSVMAFWGAPIPQEDHALRACMSALQMQDLLSTIRADWTHLQKPIIKVRMGINTGEMVVGNMGGAGKFNYTVIGDSVNLASRLEGANKLYRTGILASERTYNLVRHKIIGRELDLLTVSGRTEPLTTFELIQPIDGKGEPTLERFLETYTKALQLYRTRRWKEARREFQSALAVRPGDYASQVYIERIAAFELNPPPADWNGVFVMTTK